MTRPRSRGHITVSVALVVLGAVLALAFVDVDTPVIGLRQAGVVLIVIGVLDLILALTGRNDST